MATIYIDYLRNESHDAAALAKYVADASTDLVKAGMSIETIDMSAEDGSAEIWFHGDEASFLSYGYDAGDLKELDIYEAD